jgi:hypothetical protein
VRGGRGDYDRAFVCDCIPLFRGPAFAFSIFCIDFPSICEAFPRWIGANRRGIAKKLIFPPI